VACSERAHTVPIKIQDCHIMISYIITRRTRCVTQQTLKTSSASVARYRSQRRRRQYIVARQLKTYSTPFFYIPYRKNNNNTHTHSPNSRTHTLTRATPSKITKLAALCAVLGTTTATTTTTSRRCVIEIDRADRARRLSRPIKNERKYIYICNMYII